MMYKLLRVLGFGLFLPAIQAQSPDTLPAPQVLPEFIVRDQPFVRTGFSIRATDSLPLHSANFLSNRLLWENSIDVRANAPGTLATISIRGAGPSRSPVFWNGLNLQSCMNGVTDVALIPYWPDDRLEIRAGGQSAAWSSGVMGGSVHLLQGAQTPGRGHSGFVGGAMGSFGRLESSAGLGFSGKKATSSIRALWQEADNDFGFQKQGLDGKFYPSKQGNNFGRRTDLQQFNRLKINEKNSINSALWFQDVFRQIPPATTESQRVSWQHDKALRGMLQWESRTNDQLWWQSKVSWIQDFLAFHLEGDTDTSRSRQIMLSTEGIKRWDGQWSWKLGASGLRQWAQVDGYRDSTRWYGQTRLAGYSMGEWLKSKHRISILIRQEWISAGAAPFTWSVGAQTPTGRVGQLRFHLSRNFNLPTLNDRYWDKFGRTDLRPEKGYSSELAWTMKRRSASLEIAAFHLMLDDWILWQPENGIYRPDNLRKVWSRGIELNGKYSYMLSPESIWKIDFSGRMQASATTNIKVYGGAENVLGKQLPYTPKLSLGVSAGISRGIYAAAYSHQFTGKRMDNTGNAIKSFQTGNLFVSCALWKRRLNLEFRLENLWDSPYEIIRYHPMPGRNWRLGISYHW